MLRGYINAPEQSFKVCEGLFYCSDAELQERVRAHIQIKYFGYCPTVRARNNRIGRFLEAHYSAIVEQWHEPDASPPHRPYEAMF